MKIPTLHQQMSGDLVSDRMAEREGAHELAIGAVRRVVEGAAHGHDRAVRFDAESGVAVDRKRRGEHVA